MNEWQITQQVRYKLRAATWGDGSSKVFVPSSVLVSEAIVDDARARLRFPLAFVSVRSSESDPEYGQTQALMRFRVNVRLVVAVQDDELGEAPMIGANRTGGDNSSIGRGLLEIEERARAAIRALNDADGMRITLQKPGAAIPATADDGTYVLYRDLAWEAWGTDCFYYHAPSRLIATDSGGGVAALSWNIPPDRFDRTSVVLRRASGTTAPTSETDGTGITLSGALATSVSDSPGSGTWSYSLFGGYTRYGASVTDYSDAVSVTVVLA